MNGAKHSYRHSKAGERGYCRSVGLDWSHHHFDVGVVAERLEGSNENGSLFSHGRLETENCPVCTDLRFSITFDLSKTRLPGRREYVLTSRGKRAKDRY